MPSDPITLTSDAQALNSSVFTLPRLLILYSLAGLEGEEGATFRELKPALQLSDGALYANLKVLEENKYIKSKKVTMEGKELEMYQITQEGRLQWVQIRGWLKKLVEEQDEH